MKFDAASNKICKFLFVVVMLLSCAIAGASENWPDWRGPGGDGYDRRKRKKNGRGNGTGSQGLYTKAVSARGNKKGDEQYYGGTRRC